MTYRELYDRGCAALAEAGIEEAVLDARLLLEYVCHTDRNALLVHGDRVVEQKQEEQYLVHLAKRAKRVPLQHITGEQEFMGLTFRVNEHVLIPRQDTEILVEEVMREPLDGMRILDMCTGSGCILLSLMHYSNDCVGVGVDVSEDALAVARENAKQICRTGKADMTDCAEEQFQDVNFEGMDVKERFGNDKKPEVRFIQSNLFENVTGKYDIIVSNPPYIASGVIPALMPEVKDHEPMLALDGDEDGLFFYRRIVDDCREYLTRGGMLYFEIGYDQAEAVSGLMRNAGFVDVTVVKDYAGHDRVIYGRY